MQATKTLKTKIVMEVDETIDEDFKRLVKTATKLVLPILFPVLLFNSRLGMVFKTKVLGQVETMSRPNVLFKDIAGLGNAKI